jgi:hypothetical protein
MLAAFPCVNMQAKDCGVSRVVKVGVAAEDEVGGAACDKCAIKTTGQTLATLSPEALDTTARAT